MSTELLEPPRASVSPEPGRGEDGDFYEVVDEVRVEVAPMGVQEGMLASWLLGQILIYARQHELGVGGTEILFDLCPAVNRKRRPDLAFVSYARWPKGRRIPRVEAWSVAPDLAVEVVSPTNQAEDLMLKVREYFRAGVRLVWLIYPGLGEVHAYGAPGDFRRFAKGDSLDAEPVLPGFRVDVAEMFGPEGDEEAAE